MVLDNIRALLGRFLRCPELDHVIFGWVLHRQEIIDAILGPLPLAGVDVKCFSLLALPEVLRLRLEGDMAAGLRPRDGVVERSLSYLPLYRALDTVKIHTDGLMPREAAREICRRLG